MVNKIAQCYVNFAGDKTVYKKGELCKGTVKLVVTESLQVRCVRAYVYGQALTKWDVFLDRHNRQNIGREKYVGLFQTLFGNKNPSDPYVTLPTGTHSYNFNFKLPADGLPSSFEGEHGAIRYWIEVSVQTPTFSFNRSWYSAFTVLAAINVNAAVYKVPLSRGTSKIVTKALGFGNAGTLTLNAECDRKAYCAGEKIALKIFAKNDTTKDMGKVKARLVQNVHYVANDETKDKQTILSSIEGADPLMKGEEKKWTDELLDIDAVPPTTTNRTCQIIKVTYYVKVYIEVPWGFDLSVILPIAIGTVPLKQSSTPQATPNPFEIDTRGAITYARCNKGVERCKKSDGNFKIIGAGYIPMCVYAPDYRYVPVAVTIPKTVVPSAKPAVAGAPSSSNPEKPPLTGVVVTPSASTKALAPTAPPPSIQGAGCVQPPTYEQVLEMDSKAATAESTNTTDEAISTDCLLITRFPDSLIQDFRTFLVQERRHLVDHSGEIVAFSPQPFSRFNLWPSQMSVALFTFSTEERASEWFKSPPVLGGAKWATASESFVVPAFETLDENKRLFSFNGYNMKSPASQNFLKEVKDTVRPLRIKLGGSLVVSGKPKLGLAGNWLEKNNTVTFNQWPSVLEYSEFIRQVKQHTTLLKNLAKLYKTNENVIFQSEDVSQYQTSIEDEKDEEVDRQSDNDAEEAGGEDSSDDVTSQANSDSESTDGSPII